ncbi:hypothetical protein ACXHQB_23520 [Vibrio parahaemolyticus]|uniref:hypothetical protein n=1 Tax=Vibrio parahaemolyticus TaxID=670 RepID=UPI001A2C2AAD|nr:hypothetical protein [Vibrio parahaemolyticus]MCC3798299.1 hypothetical protein [Vibrio parahaemolyticus]HAS6073688.1 hypothetical protein [Vibrio vulnificus]
MESITQHDISLMSALLLDGMDLDTIGEKFEIPPSDVIQHIYPPQRHFPARVFESRLRNGTVRIGEDGIEKRCSRCQHFFPVHSDFWHNCAKAPDGFLSWCRPCELERATERRNKLKK